MTAREYLDQVLDLIRETEHRIRIGARLLAHLRECATSTTMELQEDPVISSGNLQSMEDVIASIVDLERDLKAKKALLIRVKAKAGEKIDRIPDETQAKLLRLHYLEGKTWKAISDQLGCAEGYVYVLQKRAIEALANSERRRSVCCPALNPDAPTP